MNRKEILEKVERGYNVKVPDVLPSLKFSEIEVVPMKKESIKKKYITAGIIYAAACIVALILIPLIINGGIEDKTPEPATTDTTEETYDLGGDEFVILNSYQSAVGSNRGSGDGINEEDTVIYRTSESEKRRNEATEKEFNIKLVFEETGAVSTEVSVRKLCGQNDFDAVIESGYGLHTPALEGHLYDLRSMETIDFTKSYWLPTAADSLTISDKLFITSGKFSITPIRYGNFLVFNPETIESLGYTSPYDLYDNGTWNCDTFMEMVVGAGKDLDEDGDFDLYDRYAGVDPSDLLMKLWYEDTAKKNDDNSYTCTFYNETLVALYGKYGSALKNVEYVVSGDKFYSGYMDDYLQFNEKCAMVTDGRALFLNFANNLGDESILADLIQNGCGVIPYPQASSDYSYVTTLTDRPDMLAVPAGVKDPEMTGRILDYMVKESENTIYAHLYEMCSGDTETAKRSGEMLDLILDSIRFDWARVYIPEIIEDNVREMFLHSSGMGNVIGKRARENTQKKINEVVDKVTSPPRKQSRHG